MSPTYLLPANRCCNFRCSNELYKAATLLLISFRVKCGQIYQSLYERHWNQNPFTIFQLSLTCAEGMLLYLVLFPILVVPVALQSPTVKMRSFVAARNFDNRISSRDLVAEHQTRSRSSCAAMCDVNCKCFGFNSMVKMCRIHHSCGPADMNSVEDGWKYYQIDGKCFIKYRPTKTWAQFVIKIFNFFFHFEHSKCYTVNMSVFNDLA